MDKRICVIDGQGGSLGAAVIKALKAALGEQVEVVGLGTNAIATASMLKAGAVRGATGENAVCQTVATAAALVGPISVTWANALLGEVTPRMAAAVMSSPARKFLLALSQEDAVIVGLSRASLPVMLRELIEAVVAELELVDLRTGELRCCRSVSRAAAD